MEGIQSQKTKTSAQRKKLSSFVLKNFTGYLLLLPALLIIYACVIRTNVLGIIWSFFNMKGYTVKEFVGLDNYVRVLTDTAFPTTLLNTIKYVGWSLLLGFIVPIIIAICLNELRRFRNTFRFFTYLPSALPVTVVLMLWIFMYYPDESGLLNMLLSKFGIAPYGWLQDSKHTILYIIISMTWQGCGGTAIYYFAALQGVNRELYEVATLDGAGFFKRLRYVTLPHISGITLLMLVKQIIGVFSICEQPMQMTDGGPNNASMTLGLLSYRYGFVNIQPQLAMAVGVIMFMILFVLTFFYFKLDKKVNSDY